eukprot:GHVL01029266.1.p1 GENE.GHVL01029266.1~~GHVL01029266.1.p1  ORF type:complete len:256 (+),score=35.38 GHVL01029266.1:47-769(+)
MYIFICIFQVIRLWSSCTTFPDTCVKGLTIIRAMLFMPRPYLWYRMLTHLYHARNRPTPQSMGNSVLELFGMRVYKLNVRLGRFFWMWFLASSIIASNPGRSILCQLLRRHLCTFAICDFGLRLGISLLLKVLLGMDLRRGVAQNSLAKATKLFQITIDDLCNINHSSKTGYNRNIDNNEIQDINSETTIYECAICTEEFQIGETVRELPCEHRFHPYCIDPWATKKNNSCPLCRTPVVV